MAIDLLNPLDRTSPTFRGDVDALFSGGLNNAIAQMNAELQGVHAMQAGGAYAFMYSFDSATADADPGLGRLRLNTSTQNVATVLRIDQQVAGGANIASLLDAIGAGTSVLKGAVRIVKASDPTTWMLFDVLAVNSATGYRNLTVTHRASSSASPFASGDSVMVFIDRAGDVGNGAEVLIGSADITEPTAIINFLTIFSALYDAYRIELSGMTFSAAGVIQTRLANAGVVSSASSYSSPTAPGGTSTSVTSSWNTPNTSSVSEYPLTASLELLNANGVTTPKVLRASGAYRYGGTATYAAIFEAASYIGNHAASGFQLARSAGNFTGGKVRVYGRRN